jgi:hypothetical protein
LGSDLEAKRSIYKKMQHFTKYFRGPRALDSVKLFKEWKIVMKFGDNLKG